MQRYPSRQNIVVTVFFSLLAVLFLNGCSDANNVTGPPPPVPLSPDAKLSSLTANTGPLDPAFSSDIANYTVDVATSVTSIRPTDIQTIFHDIGVKGYLTNDGHVTIMDPQSYISLKK